MDFSKVSESELARMIAEKYGADWTWNDIDDTDELVKAFFEKVGIAVG